MIFILESKRTGRREKHLKNREGGRGDYDNADRKKSRTPPALTFSETSPSVVSNVRLGSPDLLPGARRRARSRCFLLQRNPSSQLQVDGWGSPAVAQQQQEAWEGCGHARRRRSEQGLRHDFLDEALRGANRVNLGAAALRTRVVSAWAGRKREQRGGGGSFSLGAGDYYFFLEKKKRKEMTSPFFFLLVACAHKFQSVVFAAALRVV